MLNSDHWVVVVRSVVRAVEVGVSMMMMMMVEIGPEVVKGRWEVVEELWFGVLVL